MHERGQTTIIDFALGAFIFFIAFAVLAIHWSQAVEGTAKETNFLDMGQKASIAAKLLTESQGNPYNWEDLNASDAKYIGLANSPRKIDEKKLNSFKNTNYETAKKLLNLSEYEFFFEFSGETNFSAGLSTNADVDIVSTTTIVEYKGGEEIAKLTVYRT